jgi:hypothetical protein
MIRRCKQDVIVTEKMFRLFQQKKTEWNAPPLPFRIEHRTAAIMNQQAINGWLFDMPKALRLEQEIEEKIAEIDLQIQPLLQKECKFVCLIEKPFLKSGELTVRSKKYLGEVKVGGSFSVVKFVAPDINSESQMKSLLLSLGWRPTEWNYKKDKSKKFLKDENGNTIKASPKLTEDSYESLPEGVRTITSDAVKIIASFKPIKRFD